MSSPPTVLVTGANSGIGFAASRQMAAGGARVILACRSPERGEAARERIASSIDHDALHLLRVDLASMSSVRAFASEVRERFGRLDALVHNAANFDLGQKTPAITDEGFEAIFATNHLAPFLLSHLLLDRLEGGGRILTVGSKGLVGHPFLRVELDNLDGSRKYSPSRAYYHSKLCQLVFTVEAAARWGARGVHVNHVRVTNVAVPDERLPDIPGWLKAIYRFKRRFAVQPEDMAATYTWLALSDEAADLNGAYVELGNKVVALPRRATDPAVRRRLWRASAELVGLDDELEHPREGVVTR